MYAKLALRNVRRTARDYLIYVVTLILSVGMFYGFFSLASPCYSAALPVPIHLEVLKKMMQIAVPLVGLLAIFLMSYVNSYMLRRKQREFAVETIIGMEQRTVAFLFFLETSIMGIAAILLGVLLGMLLSQIISIVVVQSFGETYRLHFTLFPDTFLGTVLFFGAIVLLMGIRNLFAIRKLKIIEMLQNSQKGVENVSLTRQVGKLAAASAAVSVVVLGMMAALIPAVSSDPSAFFRVLFLLFLAVGFVASAALFCRSGRKKKDGSGPLLALTLFGAAEGITLLALYPLFDILVRGRTVPQAYLTMPPVFALLLLVFSLIAFFSNLTWFLSKALRKPSARYYRNLFWLGQIKSRMGTSAKMMGVISCVLAVALVIFSYLPVLAIRIQSYQLALSVYDVQMGTMYRAEESSLPTGTLDYEAITGYLEEGGYSITGKAQGELYFLSEKDIGSRQKDIPFLAVSLSDYNELRELSGLEPAVLHGGTFGIAWSRETLESEIQEADKNIQQISVNGSLFHKAQDADFQDSLGINLFTSRTEAVYILPDTAVSNLRLATTFYSANTDKPLSFEFAKQFEQEMGAYQRGLGNFPSESAFIRLNTLQSNEGISNMLLLSLIGIYAALVLLVSSFTMLSIQQLTDAVEQKHRFDMIRKLGVERQERQKIIRRQMYFSFGLPVLTAAVGSIGAFAYLIWRNYKEIVAYVSLSQIGVILALAYTSFIIVFGCYFVSTYFLFQRNMENT